MSKYFPSEIMNNRKVKTPVFLERPQDQLCTAPLTIQSQANQAASGKSQNHSDHQESKITRLVNHPCRPWISWGLAWLLFHACLTLHVASREPSCECGRRKPLKVPEIIIQVLFDGCGWSAQLASEQGPEYGRTT